MAQNIYNISTGQKGYQVEGGDIPAGWALTGDPTAKQVPLPAGVPAPVTDTGVRRYASPDAPPAPSASTYDTQAAKYYGSLDTSQPDEAAIRSSALAAVEAQKNAIENTYAGLISNEQMKGQGRLGATRALNARSGTLGSDFGNENMAETEKGNAANEKALADERTMKIETLLGQVNQDVQNRVQKQKELATLNSEKRLAYEKDLGDRAKEQVKNLAGSGFSVDQLTNEEYNHFLDSTGYTPQELKAQFVLNTPKADVLHTEVIGSNYIQVSKDPITGKTKTDVIPLGVTIPQGYKTEKLSNGQVVFYPEKFDPSKPVSSQVFTYGQPTSTSEQFKLSSPQKTALIGQGFDPQTINTFETYLNSHGIDETLNMLKSNGQPLSDPQKAQIKSLFTGGGSGA